MSESPGQGRNSKESDTRQNEQVYIALAVNPDDKEEIERTQKSLERILNNKELSKIELGGKTYGWGQLTLNQETKYEVEKCSGIQTPLNVSAPLEGLSGDPEAVKAGSSKQNAATTKRNWIRQPNAEPGLVRTSQPKGTDVDQMRDFVHDDNGGEGVFVYVVDTGVNIGAENEDSEREFVHFDSDTNTDQDLEWKVLQTREAQRFGTGDPDGKMHGTCVASKLLGQKFGVAKGATLIPVVLRRTDMWQLLKAFDLILSDVNRNEHRATKTLVACSLRVQPGAQIPAHFRTCMREILSELFALGIPIIFASGNRSKEDMDSSANFLISDFPQILEGPNFPIINVGASNLDGTRASFGQTGPQLTLYAPGVGVSAQSRLSGQTHESFEGTSSAAPIVAGVIATYMAHDPPPWDSTKEGKERVQAIKDYIRTDASSWDHRPPNEVRIIWNGANEADHRQVGANPRVFPPGG